MREIFSLIYRNRIFILFLILEGLALALIVRSRSYPRSIFFNSANAISGNLLEERNKIDSYFHLDEENEDLANENALLRTLITKSSIYESDSTQAVTDSNFLIRYEYIPARVVNSSYRKLRNYITIDKGSKSGIEPEMGVIGPNGAVGVVKDVSDHFAVIIPLINPEISITGRFEKNGYFGPLRWEGDNYTIGTIYDIPRNAPVDSADVILTDTRSLIFPPGISIGTVVKSEMQIDRNFYEVSIAFSTDFASLQSVYVVKDFYRLEQQNLQLQSASQ